MNTLTLNAWGSNHKITLHTNHYAENGNLYVGLVSWDEGFPEPWSDLTVNLSIPCKPNCAFVDTNNCPWAENFIEKYKLGMPTGDMEMSGFCIYPEYEFDLAEIAKYAE